MFGFIKNLFKKDRNVGFISTLDKKVYYSFSNREEKLEALKEVCENYPKLQYIFIYKDADKHFYKVNLTNYRKTHIIG